jgi:hypothetical protein
LVLFNGDATGPIVGTDGNDHLHGEAMMRSTLR